MAVEAVKVGSIEAACDRLFTADGVGVIDIGGERDWEGEAHGDVDADALPVVEFAALDDDVLLPSEPDAVGDDVSLADPTRP